MAQRAEQAKAELIERLTSRAREKIEPQRAAEVERFIRQLYANVPPGDILQETPEALYCSAVSLWNFAAQRTHGKPKVRAFNPNVAEHGWRSTHTVVEIANDDMPFLVDSVTAELNRRDLTVHLIIHPVLRVRRDRNGRRIELCDPTAETVADKSGFVLGESLMHIEIDEQSAPEALEEIRKGLERVLADVRVAVQDWRDIRGKIAEALVELETTPPPLPREKVEEAKEFLRWLDDDHFTFLGYREYDFAGEGDTATLSIRPGSGLGILRDEEYLVFDGLRNLEKLPPEVRYFVRKPRLLLVTKSNQRATVHRPVLMDTIGVKRFDAGGKVVGERLFVGLFTSVAYSRSPRQIPLLRRKVQNIVSRAGFPPDSHDGKALLHILENYPRDELLQIGEDDLYDITLGVLHLQERQRIALFVRRDPFERYMSCLVYVPRDRFSTALRLRFQEILEQAYEGEVTAAYTYMGDEVLGRVHFIVKTAPGRIPPISPQEIEARLVEAGRSWSDELQDALVATLGEERGIITFRRFAEAFPSGYRERFNAALAVHDIARVEEATRTGRLAINLYRPIEAEPHELRLKIYNAGGQVALSDILPMIEHMGLKVIGEVPYEVAAAGGVTVWLHDFEMETPDRGEIDVSRVREPFQDALARVWSGDMEDDGFNELVLSASLSWREVVVLRAICKFLRQANITFSQAYMEETLANNPRIARLLTELFQQRFDPQRQKDETRSRGIIVEIEHALDEVQNLDEDRILRRYLNLILSTLRTNHFQMTTGGVPKPYLSLKLDSRAIDELPLPRPMVEIFVYAPRVEAVHLRGGKVARGGIRWSDRREDFRTEVLGLMKAQMVKNAVIVPVGSKGGFVVKRPPFEGGREALRSAIKLS